MKGKASFETSTCGKTAPMRSRERGPTTGKVHQFSVTEVQWTRSSGHSVWAHSSIQSRIFAAPPVVVRTRKRSSARRRSEEHTSELQSRQYLVCRLLLEKKKIKKTKHIL